MFCPYKDPLPWATKKCITLRSELPNAECEVIFTETKQVERWVCLWCIGRWPKDNAFFGCFVFVVDYIQFKHSTFISPTNTVCLCLWLHLASEMVKWGKRHALDIFRYMNWNESAQTRAVGIRDVRYNLWAMKTFFQ